jgi:hypothetical protein
VRRKRMSSVGKRKAYWPQSDDEEAIIRDD